MAKTVAAFWIHEVDIDPESGVGKFVGEFTTPVLEDGAVAYNWLREKIGKDNMVELVQVAPRIDVWCDEEFRLKGDMRASAIIRGRRGDYDFGGAIIITAPTHEKLEAFLHANVRVPPAGYELAEPHMEFHAL
jgi:hypothetical protein